MTHCKTCNKELENQKRTYCSNPCKFADSAYNKGRVSKEKNEDILARLTCLHCNFETKDILNKSGILGKHVNQKHPHLDTTDLFTHFTSKRVEEKPTIKCPECEWTTIDVDNKSGWFWQHQEKKHGYDSKITFAEKYPQYYDYLNNANFQKDAAIEKDSITCAICNKKMEKLSNTHLDTHNITMDEYKKLYPNSKSMNNRVAKLQSVNSTITNLNREYTKRSKAEIAISDKLKSYGLNVIDCYRKLGFEVDMYLPDHNLAIEFNGLRWHSEFFGKKPQDYHLDKTEKCEAAGIHLIHIFEDEWVNSSEIVMNKILHLCNVDLGDTKVYARKCVVKEITSKESNAICKESHLQGGGAGFLHLGLFHENELVSVIIISQLRKSLGQTANAESVEISRFCNKKGFKIIGGFSKLLSAVKKKLDKDCEIISYADRRYTNSNKNMYISSGFELLSKTKKGYFYTKGIERFHRYNFTKQAIVKNGGDVNKTELQNMLDWGYDRMWDCGMLKYSIKTK